MLTPRTGRFLIALGILTGTLVIGQSVFGGNIGLWVALGFAFWYLINHDLSDTLVRPLTWATGLLTGE